MAKCTVYGCMIVAVSYIVCSSHCLEDNDANRKNTGRSFFKEKLKSINNNNSDVVTNKQNKLNIQTPKFFEDNYTDTNSVNLDNLLQLMQRYPQFKALSLNGKNNDLTFLNKIEKLNSTLMENSSDRENFNSSEQERLNNMIHHPQNDTPLPDNKMEGYEDSLRNDYGNIDQNLKILFHNDDTIQKEMMNMSKITDNIQEYILDLTVFDKEFKHLLIESEIKVANKTEDIVRIMKYMQSAMQEILETQKRKNELLQAKLSAMETNLNVQQFDLGNKDFKVTKSSCNAERRHLVKNSCYYIPKVQTENQLYTWWDSRYHCKEILGEKADLCIIETKQEMDDVQSMLSHHFGDIDEFWIGATNLYTKTNWEWVNGVPLSMDRFISWVSSINLYNEVHCMSIYNVFQFNAEPCYYLRYPICEIQLEK